MPEISKKNCVTIHRALSAAIVMAALGVMVAPEFAVPGGVTIVSGGLLSLIIQRLGDR